MKSNCQLLLLSMLFMCLILPLNAQENLIYSEFRTNKYTTNQFILDAKNNIHFVDAITLDSATVNTSEVSNILFLSDSICEIHVPTIVMHNIYCNITYLSDQELDYTTKLDPEVVTTVSVNNVFAIQYADTIENIDQYEQYYTYSVWESINKQNKLDWDNVREIKMVGLNSFNKGELQIQLERKSDKKIFKTTLPVTEGNTIIINQFNARKRKSKLVLLSDDIWTPVTQVEKIEEDRIKFIVLNNNKVTVKTKEKAQIQGVFFQNYADVTEASIDEVKDLQLTNIVHPVYSFIADVSYGYGYKLGRTPSNLSNETRKMISNLRSGRIIHANMAFLISDTKGVGFKYSDFQSEYQQMAISSVFYGISYVEDVSFAKGKAHYYSDVSLGMGREETSFGNYESVVGQSFAMHMDLKVKYMLTENIAIGGGIGLMAGKYRNIEDINTGETMELEEPESLYRFEATFGISFYL